MIKEFLPKSIVCFKEGYPLSTFKKDLIAGITVGIVALPLAMAFAIASGLTPDRGLYTAIIAGFLISLLGGSRVQIGGPTGAFVVIVYDIVQRRGYEGLALATLIAAVILILMALFRLGSLIKYIPYPLVVGFTSGIAVMIFSSQIKDFFGLHMGAPPADFVDKWSAYFQALPSWDPTTLCIAVGTLALILGIRRYIPAIPWGIASIAVATLVCYFFHLPVETIVSRYGEIPRTLPFPSWPSFSFHFDQLSTLIPDAVTIALLAGIESLLSAVVADGMTGRRHKSNVELMGQGFANLGSVFFGGLPATGAIARTATNVKAGAQTPVAGMIHAATLFCIILAFAPIVSQIPLAALSAVLIMVAWNMSEISHFRHLFNAPSADIAVLLCTFLLTVLVDLTVAVEVGMILAAFLFLRRMMQSSKIAPSEDSEEDVHTKNEVPPGIEVYEIQGPFFFGVADHLKDILRSIELPPKVFILRLKKVPFVDATAMHALKDFYLKCKVDHTLLLLSGVTPSVAKSLHKYGLEALIGKEHLFTAFKPALAQAKKAVAVTK